MSQGSLTVADGSGLAVLAAINAALARLATKASGTSRPSDIATGEFWIETDNPGTGVWSLWLYDGASDILVGTIDSSTHKFTPAAALFDNLLGATQGMLAYRGASAWGGLAVGSDSYKGLFTGGAGANPSWAGTWKVLGEATPSGASNVDFTGIPAAVHHLRLEAELSHGTDGAFHLLRTFGADGNIDDGSNNYLYSQFSFSAAGSAVTATQNTAIAISPGTVLNSSNWGVSISAVLPNIQRASYTKILWGVGYVDSASGNYVSSYGTGARQEADRITGVRLLAGSGTITGRAVLLGMSN